MKMATVKQLKEYKDEPEFKEPPDEGDGEEGKLQCPECSCCVFTILPEFNLAICYTDDCDWVGSLIE